MKTKRIGILILVLIAFGSIGCSSSPSVYYWGDKAYARDPRTGEIRKWEYKTSEDKDLDSFDHPGRQLPLTPVVGYLAETISN